MVLLQAFHHKDKIATNMRTKLLQVLVIVVKKSWERLDFKLDWKLYWDEYLRILQRSDRYDINCSETILNDYFGAYVRFLLAVRPYFDPFSEHSGLDNLNGTVNKFGSMVNYAMQKLSDQRTLSMFEGVTLLFTCLPTDYPHYDELLPSWTQMFAGLDNNETWEYCWLSILSRARKHSNTFDWGATLPFFLSLTRDLMALPATNDYVATIQSNSFPKGMPGFYTNVIQEKDQKRKKICKLTKIILAIIIRDCKFAKAEGLQVTLPTVVNDALNKLNMKIVGLNQVDGELKASAIELVYFLQSLRVYAHPSNNGSHVSTIAQFIALLLKEISKHIGFNIAHKVADQQISADAANGNKVIASPLDAKLFHTYDHLFGVFLTFCFEGIYSKGNVPCQRYMLILMELITLKPSIVHALVPHLLDALDAKSVTQPHQGLSAIHTLSRCMKVMLHPNPIIIQYLPDILRLVVDAMNPSDVMKTSLAMDLIANIFSWLPVSSTTPSLKGSFSSYLHLVNLTNSNVASEVFVESIAKTHLETLLQFITTEWFSLYLDKLFALIDGQEKKVKGVKTPGTVDVIARGIGFLFQSIDVNSTAIVNDVADKLIHYVLNSAPIHTPKVCGKILECIACCVPRKIREIIEKILNNEDLITGKANAERISFRVRLVGACCRMSQGQYILECYDLIKPLFNNTALLYHEDHQVRKAIGKLAKDFFKGCTAVYPVSYFVQFKNVDTIGAPNLPTVDDVRWHVPTKEVLSQSVAILSNMMDFSVTEMKNALAVAVATAPSSTTTTSTTSDEGVVAPVATAVAPLTYKRCEDMVGSNLSLLRHIIRGVAELLMDEDIDVEVQHQIHPLPSTGRDEIISQLDPDHVQYLKSFRRRVFELLSSIDDELNNVNTQFRGLRDNEFIAKQWTKNFALILTRRTSFNKDCENAKTALQHYKKAYRPLVILTTYKTLKSFSFEQLAHGQQIANTKGFIWNSMQHLWYWKFHDINANDLTNRIWLQRSIRSRVLSQQSIRQHLKLDNNNDIITKCMNKLLDLARHEYDGIRPQARKILDKISNQYLGYKITFIIDKLLSLLIITNPQPTYYQLASTLVTLKQNNMMKRIACGSGNDDLILKRKFLSSLMIVQRSASLIDDMEKRDKIMLALSDAFVKYTSFWLHSRRDVKVLQSTMNREMLSLLGFTIEEVLVDGTTPVPSTVTVDNAVVADGEMEVEDEIVPAPAEDIQIVTKFAFSSNGLRLDSFFVYLLLHTVGMSSLQFPAEFKGMWTVALHQLTTAHGQPTQVMAVALLIRLVEVIYQAQSQPDEGTRIGAFKAELIPIFRDLVSNGGSLVLGLARANPKANAEENTGGHNNNSSGNAQWSRGIDSVINATTFLRVVKARSFGFKRYEHNLCSAFFRKDAFALFYSLFATGIMLDFNSNEIKEDLKKLLDSTKNLSSSSEAETRTLNSTRSEFVGGLLRYLFELISAAESIERVHFLQECEQIVLDYFIEILEPLSMDYTRDWQEGFSCAFESHYSTAANGTLGPFATYIANGFGQSIQSTCITEDNASSAAGDTAAVDEGFSSHAKNFMLANGLIHGDGMGKLFKQQNESEMIFAHQIIKHLSSAECSMNFPYRALRVEISSTINSLFDYCQSMMDLDALIVAKLQVFTNASTAVEDPASDIATAASDVASSGAVSAVNNNRKYAVDFSSFIIRNISNYAPLHRVFPIFMSMLPILMNGLVHPDPDVMKAATDAIKQVMLLLLPTKAFLPSGETSFYVAGFCQSMLSICTNTATSWRVKELLNKLITSFMVCNWFSLSNDERKALKDIFAGGINDAHVNVQEAAKDGMVAYLSYKTGQEIKGIADVYLRNSEALATR